MTSKPIRTVSLLARGDVGLACARLLARDRGLEVVSYVSDSLGAELRRLFPKARRFSDATSRAFEAHCRAEVDCLLSLHFNVIVPQRVLDAVDHAFNLHPGLLPHGRGYWPTYWAIVDRSPAGCTLHEMVARVDRGRIVGQKQVPVLTTDDGEALTRRVNAAEIELFKRLWPRLRAGRWRALSRRGSGTYHERAEGVAVRRLELDRPTTARRLIDLLRAFTDRRFDGCYFESRGKKICLRLSLYEGKPR